MILHENSADFPLLAERREPAGGTVPGAMELELHQLDLRYAALRRRDGRRERALLASLMEAGQQVPVVVVKGEAGRFVLVDGYKRVRALQRLRRDTVAAISWALEEPEALLLERLMHTSEGTSALEQGWLLRELHERFGLSAIELARRFDKSPSWVSRRLALVRELPEAVQELVRKGELAAHAAMKHLVPLARANPEGCTELAPALAGHGLSSRQVATLCTAWVTATPESQKLILSDPLLILRAEEQAQRPREKTSAERLLSDVSALAGISRRARRLLQEDSRCRQGLSEVVLRHAVTAAQAETEALFAALRQEVVDA
jgi:ParB/RepB/Spo0J family partition protein